MIAGGGVGPFASPAPGVVSASQAHIEAAARIVVDITDEPVAPFAPTVREIVTAHRFGLAREAVCQLCGWSLHRRCPLTPRHGRRRPEVRHGRADGAKAGRRAPMFRSRRSG